MIKKYDELLESMGFKEKDFEKLNKYIHNHTTHEINESLSTVGQKNETTLHLALMTLLKVNDLDKIVVLDGPHISEAHNIEIKIFEDINGDLPKNIVEDILNHDMVEQTVNMINEKTKCGDFNVFILFNNKWLDEKGCFHVNHRYK
jgi:hypothetical protein